MTVWSLQEAIDLIVKLEAIAPKHGAHVALTGGLLYKDGRRKDADILFYRIRQVAEIDVDGLFDDLESEIDGISIGEDYGWCVKANYNGRPIDFLFPEREGDEYPQGSVNDLDIDLDFEEEI